MWLAAFAPVTVYAAADPGSVMSADDRAAVIRALTAVRKGQWKTAENLVAQTRDPLAAKIYYWLAYTRNAGDISFDRVTSFAGQNPDWPDQGRLRLTAEKAITDSVPDERIIEWFEKRSPLTAEGMERYLAALNNQGRIHKLQDVLKEWWEDAPMPPGSQVFFLKKYGRYLDEKMHRIRFNNMLHRKNYTNARALARIMGRGYPALAEARIAVAEQKGGVDRLIAAVPPHLENDPGLAYERLRWRRRHDKNVGAMEILHSPPPAELITNPDDWWKERHIIARRLMEEGQFESAYLLVEKHQQEQGVSFAEAEFLAGWLALKIEKPWRAFEHFEALYHRVEMPISRARGAYWAARASDELGHAAIARKWYRAAARHQTTYYGQLALAALDDEFKPPQQMPPQRTLQATNAFNRSEMVQAVRIFNKAGLKRETAAFLDALAEKIDEPEDYILVADLAEELKYYHKAVRIAKQGLQKNIFMMEHAYPTILARMKGIRLEWALVHATIRQESAFDFDAQSPAGARGLMQLMPGTAAEVARRKGLSYRREWLTTRPDYNIKLGSAYMEQMIARFDGSYALALAAYNAGPGRVNRWLGQFGDPRKGEIDIVDWVELIPVGETRNYVQRVLEGVYVYRIKLRDVQQSADSPIHVASGN